MYFLFAFCLCNRMYSVLELSLVVWECTCLHSFYTHTDPQPLSNNRKCIYLSGMSFRRFLIYLLVGPTYGRKTMTGLLHSQRISAGENQVGHALAEVQPQYHYRRVTQTESETDSYPYFAEHFGHKIHIDQNEKLVMFGAAKLLALYLCLWRIMLKSTWIYSGNSKHTRRSVLIALLASYAFAFSNGWMDKWLSNTGLSTHLLPH